MCRVSYFKLSHQGSALLQVALYSKPSVLELLTRTIDGTTRPWAFLSLPGIRVGALALYHNQMCLELLTRTIADITFAKAAVIIRGAKLRILECSRMSLREGALPELVTLPERS